LKKIQLFFEKFSDIDAIFCINNLVLFRALRVIKSWEEKNGREVLLSAFDVGRFVNLIDRPLIYADQDLNKVAESAVNLLLARIEGREIKKHQIELPFKISEHMIDHIS
jgi:DNA-binding LacI/PurR family transcriptional regulator